MYYVSIQIVAMGWDKASADEKGSERPVGLPWSVPGYCQLPCYPEAGVIYLGGRLLMNQRCIPVRAPTLCRFMLPWKSQLAWKPARTCVEPLPEQLPDEVAIVNGVLQTAEKSVASSMITMDRVSSGCEWFLLREE